MTARILWRQRESLRRIQRKARATADPLERLRYVRNQMGSWEPPERSRWWPARKIAIAMATTVVAVLLVWWIR